MNENIRPLLQSLFAKNSVAECSFAELQKIINEYPWFAPGQLLYALKQKEINIPLYHEQLQKTSLHFYNPLWLDYLLNSESYKTENKEPILLKEEDNSVAKEQLLTPAETLTVATTDEKQAAETETFTETEKTTVVALAEEAALPAEISNSEMKDGEVIRESTSETVNGEIPAAETIMNSPEEQSPVTDLPEETTITLSQTEDHSSPETAQTLPLMSDDKISQPVDEPVLTFEPYHTVDYFASQGIKLSEPQLAKDRLGTQLKSFTEWLKTMKKLPMTEVEKAISSDPKVTQLASQSVSEEEVVTETMADVWLHQGNKEKAIDVYRKLSLLNPAKSAYFASLIEQLKNN